MGLTRSLSTGASSLRAHQLKFDVISNNLANTNTVAYKSNRANFAEQFNQIYTHGKAPAESGAAVAGGKNPMQFGLGVKLGAIQQNMSQGVIETTDRPLDMAIQGDGFFVYNSNGQEMYSRAGAVSRDRDGYLVDSSSGAYLQGYNVETDASGAIQKNQDGLNILSGQVSDLRISSDTISAPRQTESITMKGNLNSGMPQGNERRTSINVYDANGGMHSLTFVFTRNANQNEFDLAAEIDGNQVALSSDVVQFNNDGTLNTPLDVTVTAADLNTAVGNQIFDEGTPKDISIQLGDPDNLVSGSLTNFSGLNTATASNQDGYQSGELIDISVDPQGKLWGAFTNGQSELLGQTVIAKFTNNDGLVREGSNFYSASPNSGLANIGTAGEIFPSTKIAGQSLEMSNVDMTTQFVDMISTQRAFEAASRTITLSDQLLAETNQLKR